MGRNKALLPYRGTVLARYVAQMVRGAAGSATLVGPPDLFDSLGFTVKPDIRPGAGPLAGIETALTGSQAEWNLIVACDMPGLHAALLEEAIARARRSAARCVIPQSAAGKLEPLCAVWHRSCLHPVRRALDSGQNAIHDLLPELDLEIWQPAGDLWHENLNTPEDWERHGRIKIAGDE